MVQIEEYTISTYLGIRKIFVQLRDVDKKYWVGATVFPNGTGDWNTYTDLPLQVVSGTLFGGENQAVTFNLPDNWDNPGSEIIVSVWDVSPYPGMEDPESHRIASVTWPLADGPISDPSNPIGDAGGEFIEDVGEAVGDVDTNFLLPIMIILGMGLAIILVIKLT